VLLAAPAVEAGIRDLGLTPRIRDLLSLKDRKASDKQETKKNTAKTEVALERNALVLVPNIDSSPEKLSIKPPPLPLWIRINVIKTTQTTTWITITKLIIFPP
jgi:hypothetical protein